MYIVIWIHYIHLLSSFVSYVHISYPRWYKTVGFFTNSTHIRRTSLSSAKAYDALYYQLYNIASWWIELSGSLVVEIIYTCDYLWSSNNVAALPVHASLSLPSPYIFVILYNFLFSHFIFTIFYFMFFILSNCFSFTISFNFIHCRSIITIFAIR